MPPRRARTRLCAHRRRGQCRGESVGRCRVRCELDRDGRPGGFCPSQEPCADMTATTLTAGPRGLSSEAWTIQRSSPERDMAKQLGRPRYNIALAYYFSDKSSGPSGPISFAGAVLGRIGHISEEYPLLLLAFASTPVRPPQVVCHDPRCCKDQPLLPRVTFPSSYGVCTPRRQKGQIIGVARTSEQADFATYSGP